MRHYLAIVVVFTTLSLANVPAEVILDGSWGRSDVLQGPHFDIGADLGQQVGNNLFHSFQTFNLQQGDIATFSGPNQIKNVISRVTGGTVSTIDGTLRSTLPQADMYFLNPAGIIFGEHAQLDVQGAMHFSTADELLLGEDGKFVATVPQNSLLTISPPSAFGFLSNTPAPIIQQGGQLIISEGKTLSLIGGNIELQPNSLLQATQGRMNIASVASSGKVIPTSTGLELNNFAQRGNFTGNHAKLDVSGEGAGSIYIRAGQFFLDSTEVLGITKGNQDGKVIDIAVEDLTLSNSTRISSSTDGAGKGGDIILNIDNAATLSGTADEDSLDGIFANTRETASGNAGTITITANSLNLLHGVKIGSGTFGVGQGGEISLKVTNTIKLSNFSKVFANTDSTKVNAGNAGIITLTANKLNLTDGAKISSLTFGPGQSGKININVTNSVILSGADIFASSESEDIAEAGDAGTIFLKANQLALTYGAQISSATFGNGQGGTITINIDDIVSLEGYTIVEEELFPSAITATTFGSGNAGAIKLTAKHLKIKEGAGIGNITVFGSGKGGEITIETTDSIHISGSVTEKLSETQEAERARGITSASLAESTGNAGKVVLNTPLLILTDGGEISTVAEIAQGGEIELNVARLKVNDKAAITSESQGEGDAGHIRIDASDSVDVNNAKVSTQATVAAGGNITINAPNRLYLREGAVTTSVQGGTGDGGNITIQKPLFVVLDNGKIVAQAYEGRGGNILITADNFVASPDSLVSASSKLGIDGEVRIDSPDDDISGDLLILVGKFFDASNQLQPPCTIDTALENLNTFVVKRFTGSPPSPQDWKANRVVLLQQLDGKNTSFPKGNTLFPQKNSALKVAFVTGCGQPKKESSLIPTQLF